MGAAVLGAISAVTNSVPAWLVRCSPILMLVAVVVFVVLRLPAVELGHTPAFIRRRVINWLPLGLTYAFLYMGRYNLTVSKNALGDLMTKAEFGDIFFWGTLTYGIAFLVNGPLTDRFGGRWAILMAAGGSAVMNALMGWVTHRVLAGEMAPGTGLVQTLSVLYALNMYFQSFGAVAIVKVNAAWFHVRERGMFGAIFSILISLGIYFAFDLGRIIIEATDTWWVFWAPAIILGAFVVIDYFLVRDLPSHADHADFDTADASSGDSGPALGTLQVAKRMFTHPVIVIIALVEFCSGFLRNAIMHWYIIFAKQTGVMETFVPQNWGMLLCIAGILGGAVAGVISDRLFQSRRGPVSAVLYGCMSVGSIVMLFALQSPMLGWVVVAMSLCVIGVHGMLSGTASMDFGGRRNVGVAVGIIDGCVYLGTAAQSLLLGHLLPAENMAQDASHWQAWPVAMAPLALIGFVLSLRLWHATPQNHRVGVGVGSGSRMGSAARDVERERAGGITPKTDAA